MDLKSKYLGQNQSLPLASYMVLSQRLNFFESEISVHKIKICATYVTRIIGKRKKESQVRSIFHHCYPSLHGAVF